MRTCPRFSQAKTFNHRPVAILFIFLAVTSLGCYDFFPYVELKNLTYQEYMKNDDGRRFDPRGATRISIARQSTRDSYDILYRIEISKTDWDLVCSDYGYEVFSTFANQSSFHEIVPPDWPELTINIPKWWVTKWNASSEIVVDLRRHPEKTNKYGDLWIYDPTIATVFGWEWSRQYSDAFTGERESDDDSE